jgi:hypothetical protein
MQFIAALFGQRQTDQPARVPCHEIDHLRCGLFGRAHEIALIFAVFVVHDDDHPPFANVSGSVRNGSKSHGLISNLQSATCNLESGIGLILC